MDILHTTKVILHCFVFDHVVATFNYMSFVKSGCVGWILIDLVDSTIVSGCRVTGHF